jgi:hypothetical protein
MLELLNDFFGTHRVRVRPGRALVCAFTLCGLLQAANAAAQPSVTSFTLINADTDQPVAGFDPIPNGATIDLAAVGTVNLNIRANTSPATTGSVRFGLDSNASYATDNATPYSLGGDTSGNYAAWTPALGSHTVTATAYTSSGAKGTAGSPLTITIFVTSRRINSGGPAFTDSTGKVWAADGLFSGGTTFSKVVAIAGTVEDTLYQTERYGNFSYSLPVPNGTYTVALYFAELYWTASGKRVFNVTVEGAPAIANLDIFAAVGANTALVRTVTTTVNDGVLNINFVSVTDNAKISAIEVTPTSTTNTAPTVNAGTDKTITSMSTSLTGTASDDGLPSPPGAMTYAWSQISGTPGVTFSNSTALSTTVTFPALDTYTLRLTANDSALSNFDDVVVTVQTPTNQAPTINAGIDKVITAPAMSVAMTATATDDGLPSPPAAITYAWSKVSGPGTVSFSDATVLNPTATFSTTGAYTLRLTVSDSALSSMDDVNVTVNPAVTFTPIRINAGGPAFTDSTSQVWDADRNFTGGSTYSTSAAIGNTVDDPLYNTERYGNFSYSLTVPNGTYAVTLYFAELYWTSAGKRVFNVTAEGQTIISNLDIWAQVGANNALAITNQVIVSDGVLNLNFITVADNAKVSAIQVVQVPTGPTFTISATPASQTVTQGGSTSYTVTVTPQNNFTDTVTFGASGLPTGATVSFVPPSVSGSGSSTFNVGTAANSPTGSSTVTVTGTSPSVTKSTTATLVVSPPTFTVTGTITPTSDGAGSTVNLTGSTNVVATAAGTGVYTLNGVPAGSYTVTPSKPGFAFTPAFKNITVSGNTSGVDFSLAPTPNTVTISSPSPGSVASSFTISAMVSASIIGVQFRVDGVNVGAEDTSAPFSTTVTAPAGAHTLTAIGRDGTGNTVTSAPVNITVSAASGTAMTVNGSQTFQTMDGLGVNLNSLSWKNGESMPVLDMLVDTMGGQTWRVVFDMEDWESTNDNNDPTVANWSGANGYNAIYGGAKFQNLWQTIRYLNSKGVTSRLAISLMGQTPSWIGGSNIKTNQEDEWVEMMATMLYWAKTNENLQFDMVDPLNETDYDGIEGPQVPVDQYVRLLQKLSVKLDGMGLSSLHFLGPSTASVSTGVGTFMPAMMANSTVINKVDHFGFHDYGGNTGSAANAIAGSAYPSRNFWMTETAAIPDVLSMIGQNASAVMFWDAYDSVYNHAILAGRGTTPPNDNTFAPPLIAYNTSTGIYTPRQTFYQFAQISKFVQAGAIRVGASGSGVTFYAFRHPITGRVTIVGSNTGGSAITFNGTLSNVGTPSVFQFYRTDSSNNLARGADVVVTGGKFTFTAPANSYFTLASPVP